MAFSWIQVVCAARTNWLKEGSMESQALDLEMQPFVARGGCLACVAAYGDERL